jgi:alpha-D-ribose 1-methylphosphonate 5-triphosphate diphosphatase
MVQLMAGLVAHPLLRMVSLMDHTPGTGQYGDLARYRRMRLNDGEAPEVTERRIIRLQDQRAQLREENRAGLLALLRALPAMPLLASHDDRTEAEIAENLADGLRVSEFPVSEAAARAARAARMLVIAGAPNLVRGGSHAGNVAVAGLVAAGLVDILASDYAPVSLIHAAFRAALLPGMDLPRAIGLIGAAPAAAAGLRDRGRIAVGLRADLVRVRVHDGLPVVRAAWCGGQRVA